MSFNQPSRSDVHFDRPLTNISLMYLQDPEGFVADRSFQVIPVKKQSDRYYKYNKGDFMRDQMEQRAPATESAGANYKLSTEPYSCEVWALHRDIAHQIRDNADDPLDLDLEATEFLSEQALLRREKLFSDKHLIAGQWDNDLTGVAAAPAANQFLQWNDAASTPIEDIRLGKRRVQSKTGRRPGKLILPREVYDTLLDHPDLVDRMNRGQTSGPAMVMRANMAELFELDEILVMDSVLNTADEGATDVIDYLAPKVALLLYVPPRPGRMTPAAGYTFVWSGLLGANALGSVISKEPVPLRKSDRVEIEMAFDQRQTSSDLAQFFDAAIA